MKSGLRELTALSLLAAFCCGLAWAHDDTFFAAVFWRRQRNDNYRGDTAFTVRCRRSAQTQHPSSVAQSLLSKSKRITVCHLTTDQRSPVSDVLGVPKIPNRYQTASFGIRPTPRVRSWT